MASLGVIAWKERALCRQYPTLDFASNDPRQVRLCVQVCARCPVRDDCLAFGLTNTKLPGVLGGADQQARQVMARARRQETR